MKKNYRNMIVGHSSTHLFCYVDFSVEPTRRRYEEFEIEGVERWEAGSTRHTYYLLPGSPEKSPVLNL